MGLMIRLMVVLCLIKLHGVIVIHGKALSRADGFPASENAEKAVNDAHLNSRVKRGWTSVIVYGVAFAARTTALGVSLASVISEGCSIRPSICTDKNAINEMDKEIQSLKSQYDSKYLESKKEFLNLRESSRDNDYIEYYINEILSGIDDMANNSADGYDILQEEIPTAIERHSSLENVTSEEYLKITLGQLEISLSDIRDMVKKQTQNQVIDLAVQSILDELLTRFAKSLDKIRSKSTDDLKGRPGVLTTLVSVDPKEAAIILNKDHPRHAEILNKYGLDVISTDSIFKEELKLTGQTLSAMFDNTDKYFETTDLAIKDLKKISVWQNTRIGMIRSYQGLTGAVRNMRKFVASADFRKFTVKNFEMVWSDKLMASIGIIMDIIEIASINANWNQVADEINKARKQYEEYLADLRSEMALLEEEIVMFKEAWTILTETFKNFSMYFKDIVESTNTDFNDVFGVTRKPVSLESPIYTINFDTMTNDTLRTNQESVSALLKDVDKKLLNVNDAFKARNILYRSVADRTKEEYTVNDIYDKLKSIYGFSHFQVLIEYGEDLKEKDVVCSIAKIRIDIDKYDFFSLSPFRPRCQLSEMEYELLAKTAEDQRNLEVMRQTVKNQIEFNDQMTVADILLAVQNAYNKLHMGTYSNSITEKDIVCTIAAVLPDKQTYCYYPLSPFRPTCSAVDSTAFQQMKEQAIRRKSLEPNVLDSLSSCDLHNFCPCPTMMASVNKVSEVDIIAVIKQLQPSREQYCGTTGCDCVDLRVDGTLGNDITTM